MKFKIRFADQIVGVFVLIAIVGLAAILILIGANQKWFRKNYLFESKFKSAEGLKVGMPVKLKGFEIGRVSSISLSPDNTVDLKFHIYEEYYSKVVPNSVLELATSPLGIGGGLLFHPGKNVEEPIPEFSFIPSLDFVEGRRLVEKNLVELPRGEDLIGSVIQKVDETLVSLNSLLVSLDGAVKGTGEGPVAIVLNDLTVTSKELNALLANLKAISANLEQTTTAFRDPTGMVKTLLDPKGSVATLLDDDNELYNQLISALDELVTILNQLGQFSEFVNSSQPQIAGLLEKGKVTLDKSNDVLEAVKNNPLLRGGVPEQRPQPTTFQSYRDEDF